MIELLPDRILVPLPILLPLLGASLTLLVHTMPRVRRLVSTVTCALVVVAGALLVARVSAEGSAVVQAGDWPAPFGITLAVDRFSAAMICVSAVIVLAVLVYAFGQLDPEVEQLFFHPVYLIMAAGVSSAFTTGDLFNLFVAFEVMLIASYVLLTLGATREQIRTGMTYVVINLLASTLFVTAVGFVYAATGTVNLADLAGRVAELPPHIRNGLGLLFLGVFGIKAALFPLFFWLPDSYPTAPAPITAVFAGLLTKVGVYAIIRTQTLLFAPDGGNGSTFVLFVAGATMLVGVLGAVAQGEIKRILSFHIVSQIGYMILGLGLFTVAGLAGAILYIVHHIVVKTTLFCVGGAVEHACGTGRLKQLGGISTRAPLLAVLFLVAALSLAGLPPFSGFVAKLALTAEGLRTGHHLVVGVGLFVSLLTLFSMTKIWAGAFWGGTRPAAEPGTAEPTATGPLRLPLPMVAATTLLVVVSVGIAAFSQPLLSYAQEAAADLLDPAVYVTAVLRP
jgi:multicomponent Na+:H+ antiporter subunit D